MATQKKAYTNSLIHETSPYLLQHAHNPVNWYPWNDATLKKAKEEDKLILISIGYSACHWCHVMEKESFEDEQTADIMNKHFINIKIDREERPDVDAVYMEAVQLITGRGGWPLNCIALPDGRPVYGGTYFPKMQWQQLLLQVAEFYRRDRERCNQYGHEIVEAVNRNELLFKKRAGLDFSRTTADEVYKNWEVNFDFIEGGPNHAPKFPLPNNFEFLLRYGWHAENKECLDYVWLTLDKMAYGGIYDQIGGGFSRYATDSSWKVPHFEKMLYDNAQLVSLYSIAFQLSGKALYKTVVYETLAFIKREMTNPEGGFYSALDADSEGEEGKFYVWKKEELAFLPDADRLLFEDYFCMNEIGYWEHNNYILLRRQSDESFAEKYHLTYENLKQKINSFREKLLTVRSSRTRPGLDDKILVSWNALMIKAYVDAFNAFGEPDFLQTAIRQMAFILKNCRQADGRLLHTCKNGQAKINGFLEDYCFTIEALFALYEATADDQYLDSARQMTDFCIAQFYDHENGFFYFTAVDDSPLIARKKEISDNVIPASNSVMARVLFKLENFFPESLYKKTAMDMLGKVTDNLIRFGSSYANWGLLMLDAVYPFYEIVITGKDSPAFARAIRLRYQPNKTTVYSQNEGRGDIFLNRFVAGKTLIYVCENQSCMAPVEHIETAMYALKKN